MKPYHKITYWLEADEFHLLKEKLSDSDIFIKEAKKAVCFPMAQNIKISYVAPEAWGKYEICKRQMSWYGGSPFVGKYLVVSAFNLESYGLKAETIIRNTDFRPPKLPNETEQKMMTNNASYQQAKPMEWDNINADDNISKDRWMKIMGIRGISFEDLFITHCANHANFISPTYFIEEGLKKIPYSIAKTHYVCSACLEFYNIIGRNFKKKLVVPCPGAVVFAGLPVNRYFEVITINDNEKTDNSRTAKLGGSRKQ